MPGHVLGVLGTVVSKTHSLPFQFSVEGKKKDIKYINAYIHEHLKEKNPQDHRTL